MRAIRSAFIPGLGGLLVLAPIAAAPAHAAQGVNLAWSRCFGEGVGTQNRSFACDSNTGSEVLVVSFVLSAPMSQVSGNEIVVDLISLDDPMPLWWDFKNVGACRVNSLSMNTTADANNVICVDWAQGASLGGIGSYDYQGVNPYGSVDPSLLNVHRRLKMALAVPLSGVQDLVENTEYFSCSIAIDHRKTIGTGACGGCTGPVCLLLQSVKVTTAGSLVNDRTLWGGTTPGSDMAHWQGSGADCNLVPVKNKTWGEVKALYR